MLVVLALFVAVGTAQAATPAQETEPPELAIPFLDDWMNSPHNDVEAEAFIHWNEEDPQEVPVDCAKCHSTPGYRDYLGDDGSAANVVDTPHPVGTTVQCIACHNQTTLTKTNVIMPSGIELTGLGDESRCMECHQGRESKVSVDAMIEEAGVEDDAISENVRFRNIHYYAAAATKYGTLAKGGYEYDGMTYDANFAHVDGYDTCIGCHNPHTLEVKVEECAGCHTDVAAVEDLRNVRMAGSAVDYDGDGDVEEGVYFELEGLREALYANMQAYAAEVAGTPLVYNAEAYPYFFADANADGAADEGDTEGYASWTPRLTRAAYNYQTSLKDPGAYAHGGKYIIELLYDSIANLNEGLAAPVDMAAMRRIDAGHFAGSEEAFRHWDAEGAVPGNCARCHSDSGLPTFLAENVNVSVTPSNGLQCATCHSDVSTFTLREVGEVTFPSGATVSLDEQSNLCLECHQGRESTVSVNRVIGDTEDDTVSETLTFRNVHYFAAGATRFGTEVKGAYEYDGKEYVGFFDHTRSMNACTDCHGAHSLEVDSAACFECHEEMPDETALFDIKYNLEDWDGDGDEEEGLYYEIQMLRESLLAALQAYATETVGTSIAYDEHAHPYFYIDTNANAVADPEEVNSDNRYATWTPRLLRAAYNYQYSTKDPGAFAHNGLYIVQTLYDSIEDVGGDVSALTRP
jgi:hypothetical protein